MKIKYLAVAAALAVAGFAAASFVSEDGAATRPTTITTTGGHTPVTICHKPGTPAEQELTVDDDAVPGHLDHGDYLGPCQGETTTTETTTTNPCDTPSTDQYEECNSPPTTTETTPPPSGERCPPGMTPTAGKDGEEGNDECEFPPTTTPPPPNTTTDPPTSMEPPPVETTTAQETTTEGTATVSENPPTVTTKPKPPKAKPKPHRAKLPRACKPGAVETTPCGVQGSG